MWSESVGFSKSGLLVKDRAPVLGSMVKAPASVPLIDQVAVSPASMSVEVWLVKITWVFSAIELAKVSPPPLEVMVTASSTLVTVTWMSWVAATPPEVAITSTL